MRFFSGYRCGKCGRDVPAGSIAGECPTCCGPLLGVYDTGLLRRNMSRGEFLTGDGDGVWRFSPLLPVFPRMISLGEGNTPLLHVERLGSLIGVPYLYIKDESLNPTGSFKARGMAVAVSRLLDLGARDVCMASAGNAGLSLSAYCAFAGIRCAIYIPSDSPLGVAEECRAYGADVVEVIGILPDAARRMEEESESGMRFAVNTFREPCRVEGKKTMAFEIERQSGGKTPDWILFPTGGGTGIVALWKAYSELAELGWLDARPPRLAAVQSTGCAPVVKAFETGSEEVIPWDDPDTIASGIRVPSSRADSLILRALRESGGTAVAVSDDSILDAVREVSLHAGVFPSPEGAATWAGLKHLVESGEIDGSSRIVMVITAGGSRYRFLDEIYSGRMRG